LALVIGVDGGATKTHALVARLDGTIIGFGKSGFGSYEVAGIEPAKANILESIKQALGEAVVREEVELGCFALAGADFYPEDFDLLTNAMHELGVAKRVVVRNDSIAGLRAGTFRPYGVCIIMGTGFNGAGIGKDGQEVRFFGEGYIFGDLGGGGAIARDALFHAMRAYDGRGKPTKLTQVVLDHWGAVDMVQLAKTLYYDRSSLQKIPELCPRVFETAEEGDEVARSIILRFGKEAGVAANALIRRLGLENEEFECVMAGSVFKGKGTLMMNTVKKTVRPVAPKARVVTPRYEPVVGAVMLALEAVGVSVQGEVESRLDASVPSELRRK